MLLSDYVNTVGKSAVFGRLQTDKSLALLRLAIKSEDDILPTLSALGLVTAEDFDVFLSRVSGFQQTLADRICVRFAPKYKTLTVPWGTVHKAVATCCLAQDFQLQQYDSTYTALDYQDLVGLAKASPTQRLKYKPSVQDCDDLAKHFLGWLVECGLGNTAVGFVSARLYRGQELLGGHAFCAGVDNLGRLWFIEPQNGKVYPSTYTRLGGFFLADRMELASFQC